MFVIVTDSYRNIPTQSNHPNQNYSLNNSVPSSFKLLVMGPLKKPFKMIFFKKKGRKYTNKNTQQYIFVIVFLKIMTFDMFDH